MPKTQVDYLYSVGQLQAKNNFVIEIAGIDKNDQKILLLTKSVPLPEVANDVITVAFGNSEVKFAGKATFSGGDIVLYDSVDADTEAALLRWRAKVYTEQDDSVHSPLGYKSDATITEYAPDGTHGRQWKLEGVWPSSFKPGTLSTDDSGYKEIALTLTYDRAYRI